MTKRLDPAETLAASASAPVTRRVESSARIVIGLYAVAAIASVFVLLTHSLRGRQHVSFVEHVFGFLNVPLASTPISVVLLWIMWGGLSRRKRTALWAVAVFQLLGALQSAVLLWRLATNGLPEGASRLVMPLLVAQSVVAIVIGLVTPVLLVRIRGAFPAKIHSRRWMQAVSVTILGFLASLAISAVLLTMAHVDGVRDETLFLASLQRALGADVPRLSHEVARAVFAISQLTSALLVISICLGMYILLRPRSYDDEESPDAEVQLRERLLTMGAPDSLSYFSTRRDKRIFTSADGRASLTYRIINTVCLVSADPIGERSSWGGLIREWMAACRTQGLIPSVIGTSEEAARVYLDHGLTVVTLGDEAILRPDRFTLESEAMTSVRQAVARARRAGLAVGIHRMGDLPEEQRRALAETVANWRTERERGFSMALGRFDDPADDATVVVVAHTPEGEPQGLLSFVPWGAAGLSLDLMLRSPTAPNGTNELMVSELMAHGQKTGLARVSLNFAVFRGIFADADRLGAGLATRVNSGILGVLDRFTQVESLYRANAKFLPEWSPRYFLFDGFYSLPRSVIAAGVAEGFLPEMPWTRPRLRHALDDAQVERLAGEALLVHRRPSLEGMAGRDGAAGPASAHTRLRLAQAHRLADAGMPPSPLGAQDVTALSRLTDEDWTAAAASGTVLRVSGRAASIRSHGGVVFVDLRDGSARLQAVLERESTTGFEAFRRGAGTGDLVVVAGAPGHSRNGTPSLIAGSWSMAAKALHPIPFRGLTDPEARIRRRSTELIINPAQADRLRLRSRAVQAMRETLLGAGYTEVETPILNTVHGGASARPFRTFINAYSADLTLRIAPELQLKRLLVGGLGPVFEIGRNFRNEGADATHNPEFTALEAYEPFGDYTTMRHLTERLIKNAALQAHGSVRLPLKDDDGQLTPTDVSAPWPVRSVCGAVSEAVGVEVNPSTDFEVLLRLCAEHEVPIRPDMGPGALIEELYGEIVEPATVFPTFYVDFPVETSPLAGPHRTAPGLAERWDLVANGMEIGTAYSELTDPVEQRRRLTEQSLKAARGNPEAMAVDEDFLYALETGMPPAGGLGIGVDRLIMLLTGTSIRDVITFPFVRPLR